MFCCRLQVLCHQLEGGEFAHVSFPLQELDFYAADVEAESAGIMGKILVNLLFHTSSSADDGRFPYDSYRTELQTYLSNKSLRWLLKTHPSSLNCKADSRFLRRQP